jgi:serine/threonine protein kinase
LPTPVPGLPAHGAVPVPERLGRYRIQRQLGRGAMGTVYLAHDSQLDRQVALKVPHFTLADGPEVRQRFLREARAAATIEHPNVCPVYDVGEINGTLYLTMAYLQGQSLAHFLAGSTRLPERHAASLVRQLTGALQAAHQRGIIHRDLKPSNIMINQRGEPVLLDFGLARRQRPDDIRLTHSGQPVGTPAYMSPEQVAGAVQAMGPGCDIYALGVILYQMLTGRLPFEGSMAEVLGQIVTQQPEPPSKYRPDLDPRLEAICLKALRKEVAKRYASMQDLGAALADYLLGDLSPHARPIDQRPAEPTPTASPGMVPRKSWSGSKLLWLLIASGAAATILLASVVVWMATSMGTIRIELDGPGAEVEVRVDDKRLENASMKQPLKLSPGKHHLLVKGKKIEEVSQSFLVTRGDNPVLRVQLVPRVEDAPADPARRKRNHDDDDRERRKRNHDDDDRDDD